MSIHLTDEEIKKYHQHELVGQKLLTADLHITECEDCLKRLSELSAISTKSIVNNLRQDLYESARLEHDHVLYEQLESLADGKLDDVDLEIVQSHLQVCGQCQKEAEDLRNLGERLNQSVTADAGRVISWRRSPAFTVALRIAGVAAMVALFAWAATLPMRDRIKELQAELDLAKQEAARLTLKNTELLRQSNNLQTEIAQLKRSQSQVPMIASISDGGRVVTVDQNGNIAGIISASPLYLEKAKEALTKQNVETPAFLAGLIGKQGSLLGATKNGRPFDLTAPVGTAVLEDRPNFRWKPLKDSTGYRVRVYDRDFREIAASDILKDTNWTPSNSFPRNRTYSWIVTAYLSDKEISSPLPPAPEAKFMVLDAAQYEKLQQASQDLAQSHLLSGLLYAQFGLLDESVQEFQQLVHENPDSQIAKKLLDRVQSVRKR